MQENKRYNISEAIVLHQSCGLVFNELELQRILYILHFVFLYHIIECLLYLCRCVLNGVISIVLLHFVLLSVVYCMLCIP